MPVVIYWYDVILCGKLLPRWYSAIFFLRHPPPPFFVSEQLGSIRLTTSWCNIKCIFTLLLTASNFHTAANSYSVCFLPSIAFYEPSYIWSLTRTETHTQCYKQFVWKILRWTTLELEVAFRKQVVETNQAETVSF